MRGPWAWVVAVVAGVVLVLVVPVAFLDLTARLTAIGWVRWRRSRNIQKMG